MKRKEILLPEKRFKKASSEELVSIINLSEEKNLLTNDDRNVILDLNELFDEERNDSKNYKIFGKIRMVFRNMYSGSTDYDYLKERLYLNTYGVDDGTTNEIYDGFLPYNEFAFLRNDLYRKKPKVYSGTTLEGFDGFELDTVGSDEHQIITEITSPRHNWNLYLTYVDSQDNSFPMTYTLKGDLGSLDFVSGDGIPFEVFDEDNSYKLVSPVDHGINSGEFIVIEDNVYYVNSVGDEIYDSEKYVINLLKSQVPQSVTTFDSKIVTGKRCLDNKNVVETTSIYYIHKHKTLSDQDDITTDKVGFEESIWENEKKLLFQNSAGQKDALVVRNRMESIIYDFKNPFILTGITNNLGFTPTDVYVSVIYRNGNGYFNYPPKVGYKFNFHDDWIDNRFEGDISKETGLSGTTFNRDGINFISGNTIPIGTPLVGSFVEYIPTELKERIVSETFHKVTNPTDIFDYGQVNLNEYIGASETNPFGLYHQTHYKVKLRELSPYVETSRRPEIDNLPDNAKYYETEKLWKWRDLYSQGYIDDENYGVNHPFMNNTHYVKTDISFYLKNEQLSKIKKDGVDKFGNILC